LGGNALYISPINFSLFLSFFTIIDITPMSSEKDVVARAIKGDGEAFTQLYEANFDRIYRYIYLRVGNISEAEDLTQEVFVKAMGALSSYRWRNLPFISWLFRIARNQVIDYLRKRDKVVTQELDDNITLHAESGPADITERKLEIEKLAGLIDKLSPAQKEVIILRFSSELSIIETATALGKKQGTIKALQYTGIMALRNMVFEDK